jgi:hypothetical protein
VPYIVVTDGRPIGGGGIRLGEPVYGF